MVDLDVRLRLKNAARAAVQQARGDFGELKDDVEAVGPASERSGGKVQRLTSLGAKLGPAFKIGAAAAVAGFAAIGTAAVSRAGEIERLSRIARISTDDFQRLERQAELTGGAGEDLSDVIREMQLRLAEASALGTGPAVDALALLGLGVDDLKNKDAPAAFAEIRDRASEVEDPMKRLFVRRNCSVDLVSASRGCSS